MSYAPSEHTIGHGKRLAYSDTSAGTPTPIYGTVEIDFPERELGAEEVTNDDSPGFHKAYILGLYEPGSQKFSYEYGKTQFAAIETLFQLGTVAATRTTAMKYWTYTLPDGSTAKWQGFITKHNLPAEQEKGLVVEGEMQVSGPVVFVAGA